MYYWVAYLLEYIYDNSVVAATTIAINSTPLFIIETMITLVLLLLVVAVVFRVVFIVSNNKNTGVYIFSNILSSGRRGKIIMLGRKGSMSTSSRL